MAPILARQFCKLQAPPFHQAPRAGRETCSYSPLKGNLGKNLRRAPQPQVGKALLDGIGQGFRIGMQETPQCRP